MSQFRIDVDSAEAEAQLRRIALFMLDLRPFWPLVVPLFIGWMREQFESEGAFGGDGWAPLSPLYSAWKSLHFPGKSILQADGELRAAASRPERNATPRELMLRIVDPKVGYHQEGTDKMPARPLLFDTLPPVAQAELQLAAVTYVRGIVGRL